jgi:hypothetical protein
VKQAREVVIHIKLGLTIPVETETADEAQDQANAIADAWILSAGPVPAVRVVELDRMVNRVTVVKAPAFHIRTTCHTTYDAEGFAHDEWVDEILP